MDTVPLHPMVMGGGFRASSLRGSDMAAALDPFLGVDHAWMSAATFPPHPHAGFSAVSYLFVDAETGINNRDSLGTRNLIQPGGLHWTAAGRGVVHEEVPADTGKTVHMLQIFINLPGARQLDAPFALGIAPQQVPLVTLPGARVRVPLGEFAGMRSPLQPPTAVRLLDITLDAGASMALPLAAGDNAFIMTVRGALQIDGRPFAAGDTLLPVFAAADSARSITLQAGADGAQLVLFSGTPLRQSVHWQGPLAMASAPALASRIAAYQRGEFGSL